jgi:mono/diheme cytochrome c family protein
MAGQNAVNADPHNQRQVELGQRVYKRFCAFCHGIKLEGQSNLRIRKPDGKLPAPPHDETGHTWHHPDDVLFGIIKRGLVPPYAPEDYQSDMPSWEGTLTDENIWAVLAFIKSRWPEETRKIQEDINTQAQRRLR